MKADFHYYFSYMAARFAGYNKPEAHAVAQYGYTVDEGYEKKCGMKNSFDEWNPNCLKPFGNKGKGFGLLPRTGWRGQAEVHMEKKGAKIHGRNPTKVFPWIAYHFLPGGMSGTEEYSDMYSLDREEHVDILHRQSKRRTLIGTAKSGKIGHKKSKSDKMKKRIVSSKKADSAGGKWDLKEALICLPESDMSTEMQNDTFRLADKWQDGSNLIKLMEESLGAWGGDELENKCLGFVKILAKQGISFSAQEMFRALLGVRGHVLMDTFAHMGFAGIRAQALNDVTKLKYKKYSGNSNPNLEDLKYDGKKKKASPKAPNPDPEDLYRWNLATYFGHGPAAHYPDYPNIFMTYQRPWDGKIIRRNNIRLFYDAYEAQAKFFLLARLIIGAKAHDFEAYERTYELRAGHEFSPASLRAGRLIEQELNHLSTEDRAKVLRSFIKRTDSYDKLHHVYKDFTNFAHLDWISIGYASLAAIYHGFWVKKYFHVNLGTPYETYIKNAISSLSSSENVG